MRSEKEGSLEGVDVGGGVFVEGWGVAQDAVEEFVGVDVEETARSKRVLVVCGGKGARKGTNPNTATR